MLTILTITLPIFVIVALGWGTTRAGLFSAPDMRVLGRFVINIALPALLFGAVAKRDLAEVFNPVFLGIYALGCLTMVAGGIIWFHRIKGFDLARAGICIMGTACSNSGYMAFPILSLIYPDTAPLVLAMGMIVENLVMIPVCLIVISLGRKGGDGVWGLVKHILRDLSRRPLIVALAVGLSWSVLGLPIPDLLDRVVTLIAASTVPVALFVIGGSLIGVTLRGNIGLAAQIVFGKLILHPVAILLAFALFAALGAPALPPEMRIGLLLTAAVPMLGVYPIFAQEHGMEALASLAMLMATVLSFVTLSLALAFLL